MTLFVTQVTLKKYLLLAKNFWCEKYLYTYKMQDVRICLIFSMCIVVVHYMRLYDVTL